MNMYWFNFLEYKFYLLMKRPQLSSIYVNKLRISHHPMKVEQDNELPLGAFFSFVEDS